MPPLKQPDPADVAFWKEIRALVLSLAALIEKTKLKGHITITTAAVRRRMHAEGWEPPPEEGET